MKYTRFPLFIAAMATLAGGCSDSAEPQEYDDAMLSQFRGAIPSQDRLEASTPQDSSVTRGVGDPSVYAYASVPVAQGINGAVSAIVDTMKTIVELPPTVFNSETEEFVWGPWEADDHGSILAYIRHNPEGEDFEYGYALLRGVGNDISTYQPVIWGASTPDAQDPDRGVGITLWDLEANRAFAEANDPAFDAATAGQGRFAALYGVFDDEDDANLEISTVVAIFHQFQAPNSDKAPGDFEYFYGRARDKTDGTLVDFMEYRLPLDVTDPADEVLEDVSVRLAFLNEGVGRAEASAVGGSMTETQRADVVECWDAAIDRTYAGFFTTDEGEPIESYEEGQESNCGEFFSFSLDALGVPAFDDLDAEIVDGLTELATHGFEGDSEE